MKERQNNLSLEDIANVKIKAYKNENILSDNEKKRKENFYNVYILTYIKHIVRIKSNLALHGGLYSNYFEKYEEESISNIMFENLLGNNENTKNRNINCEKINSIQQNDNDKKNILQDDLNCIHNNDYYNKKDLNYSIKELLKKLIKSYKIRENKIFLVTGMLGCGKTTCVSLAIEYFNKYLQIEKNMKNKTLDTNQNGINKTLDTNQNVKNKTLDTNQNVKNKNVLFLSEEEPINKKIYKKTPYINKSYHHEMDSSNSTPRDDKKIKINSNEPLFNFTPRKKRKTESDESTDEEDQDERFYNNLSNDTTNNRGDNKYNYDNYHNNNKNNHMNSHTFNNTYNNFGHQKKGNYCDNKNKNQFENIKICEEQNKKKDFPSDVEQINTNIRNIFENNDLSPLRKNANIRNKIQLEQMLKDQNEKEETYFKSMTNDDENLDFNMKYKKIVDEINKEENEETYIYIIRLSAYLYRDDLQCIKSILSQLHNYVYSDEKLESNLLLNDYINKLEKILIKINSERKQTLLIIENVEKFCLQNKQNLLYTLFDLLHKKNIYINIICLTNVLDITQTLEKRIKSRFTFEMIHISPILNIEDITKLVYKILYVNLDDFHLIKKYYSVYFTYPDLIKIQRFLQIYNSTMQKEIADSNLLKQWSYDINYGLDIRHIYHTCVDAILSICEYKHILTTNQNKFESNTILDISTSQNNNSYQIKNTNINTNVNTNINTHINTHINTNSQPNQQNTNSDQHDNTNMTQNVFCDNEISLFTKKEKRSNLEFLKERPGKLDATPIKRSYHKQEDDKDDKDDKDDEYKYDKDDNYKYDDDKFDVGENQNNNNSNNADDVFFFNMNMDMSPRKLKENMKLKENVKLKENINLKNKMESQYILNNVQSKFIRRHYIKKVLRDLCTIEYMILCAFTRLYKKEILPKTLYVIILEINKFKHAYPQEQIIGFSLDAYRRSFFRLVDLDIIVLSSYSLNHLNIKNFSNDLFGLHEPTKFPCYDIFLENIDTYNLNHNLIQWVKHNTEVMQ
ncbi:conserved Plasmodium protein, unknown function [Plasmodium gaboni]|uniref:Origin recognition complex subunit 1 n=1 Tax=Plasmodium gaboni TaxID=647221 RepID=A0ABY1UT75_9APIC|nr:conserved Plasmodium protein, unknown function [Plasmodium gaboni]